ncbi:LPXTG cell wall anchor domain-containing protein [Embleya sp. NPDC055610]
MAFTGTNAPTLVLISLILLGIGGGVFGAARHRKGAYVRRH